MSDGTETFEAIPVLVETAERVFKGTIYKPVKGEGFRLSDYLNSYDRGFLCLTNVQISDRGQAWRIADTREFMAISVASIIYVTPLGPGEV